LRLFVQQHVQQGSIGLHPHSELTERAARHRLCRLRRIYDAGAERRRAPFGSDAPPPPANNGPAYWIKVSSQTDGTFTVTNTRNGFAKTYTTRLPGTN
jgi:hypothetical protein